MEEALPLIARWQRGETVRWSFSHVSEILPVARVLRGEGRERPLPLLPEAPAITGVPLPDGSVLPFESALVHACTDGLLVLHDGRVVLETYRGHLEPRRPHLLMSVTKSLVGLLAGVLVDEGALAPDDPVEAYVPHLAGSGLAGATIRHLLDMRLGVAFVEDYLDPAADYDGYERSLGWLGEPDAAGVKTYLPHTRRGGPDGGAFTYQSIATDALAWALERAGGARWDALLGDRIWSRLGAEQELDIALDAGRWPLADGGGCASLRDLARVGQLVLDGGRVGDAQVVPEAWIEDILHPPADVVAAFAASTTPRALVMPGGAYRSQWWSLDPVRGISLGVGIHGQLVLVHRPARAVVAHLASWPLPSDAARRDLVVALALACAGASHA